MSTYKIIIHHCSGVKKNQIETFDIGQCECISIGKALSNKINFYEQERTAVSKEHAFIRKLAEGGNFFIEDNNSLNGVFVNGSKIADQKEIFPRDEIGLGYKGPKFIFDFHLNQNNHTQGKVISK